MESHVNVAKSLNGILQSKPLIGEASSELDDAVQSFEAFFIQSMLKSMRSASLSTGLLDGNNSEFYQDWHDQQLASDLASKETFAVSKLLRRQFSGNSHASSSSIPSLESSTLFKHSGFGSIGNSSDLSEKGLSQPTVVASVKPLLNNTANSFNTTIKQLVTSKLENSSRFSHKTSPSTPESFVQQVYPHAQRVATKLNTSADVLVAIAALETGWGVHTPKGNYDQESFNYFGIKASGWQGPKVKNITQEYNGEKMITIKDSFRAYKSPADSFNDFAEFLLTNPRYQDALNNGYDSKIFVSELHKAGYATDPNYAKKINSILNGSILKDAIHSIDKLNATENEVSYYENNNTH